LKRGGWTKNQCSLASNFKKEIFKTIRADALPDFSGGVSQAIVCDNLKSAVTRGSIYEPVLNKTMSAFGLHYTTTALPARAYKPQDKSLVEGAVKLVYQRIFYPLESLQFFFLECSPQRKTVGAL